ncbi:hypothetical protein [Candidatus Phytoplasma sp. AldY-WA1]|uniref:hypothetical protein n=1 Tax=Candidatus Phytoplasma sp. AldY-WA1 TaxID=2852100 RepID=UPI0025501209|nr:hypothetical protein [Candidatus Phytoplasma sp. AldY-WA1]
MNRLNDKIDKHDNKLNDIDKNLELLKKDMSYYQERLNETKKTDQETKDTIIGTFKQMEKLIDNNNKKHNLSSNINKK